MEEPIYRLIWEVEDQHWWSVSLRGHVLARLDRCLPPARARRILDIGCGAGRLMGSLRRYGEVVGIDVESQALHFTRSRGESCLCLADLQQLPFRTESFQAVTALDVVEHVDDDRHALTEIARVLAPGGVAVINVPAFQWLWSGKDVQAQHKRRYVKRELLSRLPESLAVRHVSFWNTLLLPPIALTRLWQRARRIDPDLEAELKPPDFVNRILSALMRLERPLVSWPGLPIGVSLLCTVAKREATR